MAEDWLKFIPLDKSWIIRMGILDILHNNEDIIKFLSGQKDLSADLEALKRIAEAWNTEEHLDVGESGTLYRFVRFILWKQNLERMIIKRGTLLNRKICDNAEIINWPLAKLLTLDNGTSQWASAAVLCGNQEKLDNIPFKLRVTYDAVEHWEKQRKEGKIWTARLDNTIINHATAFSNFLKTGEISFSPEQAEDYCFARAFGLMNIEDGEIMFPSLKGHESNRIEEIEKAISQADNNQQVTSEDHRVVQAVAMRQLARKQQLNFANKNCVDKSWPKFWEFIESCKEIKEKLENKNNIN